MIRGIIITLIFLGIDFYAYQGVKISFKSKWILIFYWLVSISVLLFFLYSLLTFDRSKGLNNRISWSFGLLILFLIPKLIVISSLLIEDVFRLGRYALSLFQSSTSIPGRRAFVGKLALGIAALPFTSILYGIIKGKYNFKVINHTLFFDDLPKAFDGFKITHISDVHSGSFDDENKIDYAINLINEQQSDVILFTGDIVNNLAEEMNPWIDHFKKLEAPFGKFSVLGNHDYGEYIRWKSIEEKAQNFQKIKDIHPKIGFNLLLNDSFFLKKGNDKIALIGVENWGTRFKKAGDLAKASSKVGKDDFKIIMSHDPSHWDAQIKNSEFNYHLTLSGHTHGMQFGIEIPGFKWSPIQYVYKHWAGIYKYMNRYINVNRGFGFLAFPGRVGIWPEITVITLKNKELV
ncbi:MAG: metallophosphoesterase [Lutibacter sp.]